MKLTALARLSDDHDYATCETRLITGVEFQESRCSRYRSSIKWLAESG